MIAEALRHQAKANHQQEAQAQDNDSRVSVDEARQRLAGQQHQADGDADRDHHHRQMIDHADRGDHRVEREDGVQHHDLRHDRPETCAFARAMLLFILAFQPLIELHGGFEQQEYPADQHDQIAAAEGVLRDDEHRFGQRRQPRYGGEQSQTHDQRQQQTDDTGLISLLFR